ncbi:MAG: DUF1800 domain-containing protein [Ilumatobacteraceae bacterium]|nr:DUF1800 domain-containing protein [Ilumatobacteraceae bacterium]
MAVPDDDLAHLLRRTEFVVRPSRLAYLKTLPTLAAVVDDIINISANGNPALPAYFQSEDTSNGWNQYVDACSFWINNMVQKPRPFQEKMTLFWHGHFVSAWWDVGKGFHMMQQLQMYRENALGNFHTLTQKMAIDRAMLVYLSNAQNVKGSPNQNFARELMELFTLGVGNYTEADVEAAARAWTGHNADWPEYVYQFKTTRHDYGSKLFFGTTKAWDGPEIITEILVTNAAKKQIAARYITKKLWEFLAHPTPPTAVLDALAPGFAADMDLTNLVRLMLNRPEFYSVTAKQGLVRTPIEFIVALCYYTGIDPEELGISWRADSAGQQMYQPPNVAGWKPNAYWLNTSAIGGRADFARSMTWWLRNTGRPFADGNVIYDKTVPDAVDFVAGFFGITPLSTATRNALISAHQAERNATSWRNWAAPTNLLTMTMLAPEFHMA